MSQLPARPDLDQLRRQARELHRAALAGDPDALRRLRRVSGTVGPAPVLGQLTVVIEGFDLPGLTCAPEPGGQVHQNIHVALASPGKTGTRSQDRPALVIPGNPWLAAEPACTLRLTDQLRAFNSRA